MCLSPRGCGCGSVLTHAVSVSHCLRDLNIQRRVLTIVRTQQKHGVRCASCPVCCDQIFNSCAASVPGPRLVWGRRLPYLTQGGGGGGGGGGVDMEAWDGSWGYSRI